MPLAITTNSASLLAQRNLSNTQNTLSVSITRLSSGLRTKPEGDDAVGLALAHATQSNADQLTSETDMSDNDLGLYSQSHASMLDINAAQETADLTLFHVRQQATVSVLSQPNALPQLALKLLGG